MPRGAWERPTEPCPYCGTECEAEWCDVGVGYVQIGPYYCIECGAYQAGLDGDEDLPEYDPSTNWIRPKQ